MTLFVTGQGNPPPTLMWFRNGIPINASADERIRILREQVPTHVNSILSIIQTVPSDSGRYTCVVSNEAGNETAIFDVTVNGKLKCCVFLRIQAIYIPVSLTKWFSFHYSTTTSPGSTYNSQS